MTSSPIRHVVAMLISAGMVFGLRIQDVNLQPLVGRFDQRYFDSYTPYFPGLDKLETNEIFAPQNAHKKKIVFLGASTVDSIGCDTTWHDRRITDKNVHFSCSISSQLNQILADKGLTDWKSFDLARNGAKLTPMLYVYSRLLELRPAIIIWGEAFDYYLWNNADAAELTPSQYAYMDHVFNRYLDTAAIWDAYKENLEKHGWGPTKNTTPVQAPSLSPKYRETTTLADLLSLALQRLRTELPFQAPSRPLAFVPDIADWSRRRDSVPAHPFASRDSDFGYFQGFRVFSTIQNHLGGKMFFYFTPKYFESTDRSFTEGIANIFGGYLTKYDIPFVSHIDLPLKPVYETTDGYHTSVFGNRKVAAALFNDLQKAGLLP